MYDQLVVLVASRFDLDVKEIGTSQKGYRNESYELVLESGESVNLIFHKNEKSALDRIESADQASFILYEYGVGMPVRTRFDRRVLKLSDGKKEVYACLYTYLPGKTIPWEAYTKNHIKLLGWAMSDMHETWNSHEGPLITPHVSDELEPLLGRMERYFGSSDVELALKKKLGISISATFTTFESLFGWVDRMTGADDHILHMDLVRGNVLFDDSGSSPWRIDDLYLSGVIDFEKAAVGHPIYDIARTLAFLLVDCASKDRRSIYKYFLESGYNKRGRSSFKRNDSIGGMPAYRVLNMLVGFFLLHDFYKFLKHTPYESLEENHHFVRTRDILIDYGMIRLNKD